MPYMEDFLRLCDIILIDHRENMQVNYVRGHEFEATSKAM